MLVAGEVLPNPQLESPAFIPAPPHHCPAPPEGGEDNFRLMKRVHFAHPSLRMRALSVFTGTLNSAAVCFTLRSFR